MVWPPASGSSSSVVFEEHNAAAGDFASQYVVGAQVGVGDGSAPTTQYLRAEFSDGGGGSVDSRRLKGAGVYCVDHGCVGNVIAAGHLKVEAGRNCGYPIPNGTPIADDGTRQIPRPREGRT